MTKLNWAEQQVNVWRGTSFVLEFHTESYIWVKQKSAMVIFVLFFCDISLWEDRFGLLFF